MLVSWLLLFRFLSSTSALDNGLALTPPMGWLSWLFYGCNLLSEDIIKRAADRMAADGYKDAGYEYVIIDDCWLERERGPDGRMVPDRNTFKGGIKALSKYVHSKGLKFGIYQDIGTKTCAGRAGLQGHEKIDVETFVEWEVDYIKVDGCYASPNTYEKVYPAFGKLLNESGRPILYSCSWPAYQEGVVNYVNYTAIQESCNIWRNYGDIDSSWSSYWDIKNWFADNQDRLVPHAGPGHFNDPDMLIVGHPGLSVNQSRIQMAVWAMLAAPLLMSLDLEKIKPEHREVLLNRDVIAVNQDILGRQGRRVFDNKFLEIWNRELVGNSYAIAFVNKNTKKTIMENFLFVDMFLPKGRYEVQDLYDKSKQILKPTDSFSVTLHPQSVKFYKFVPKNETD